MHPDEMARRTSNEYHERRLARAPFRRWEALQRAGTITNECLLRIARNESVLAEVAIRQLLQQAPTLAELLEALPYAVDQLSVEVLSGIFERNPTNTNLCRVLWSSGKHVNDLGASILNRNPNTSELIEVVQRCSGKVYTEALELLLSSTVESQVLFDLGVRNKYLQNTVFAKILERTPSKEILAQMMKASKTASK